MRALATFIVGAAILVPVASAAAALPAVTAGIDQTPVSGGYGEVRELSMTLHFTTADSAVNAHVGVGGPRSVFPGTPLTAMRAYGGPTEDTGALNEIDGGSGTGLTIGCSETSALRERQFTETAGETTHFKMPAHSTGTLRYALSVPAWFRPFAGKPIRPSVTLMPDSHGQPSRDTSKAVEVRTPSVNFANPVEVNRLRLYGGGAIEITRNTVRLLAGRMEGADAIGSRVALVAVSGNPRSPHKRTIASTETGAAGSFAFSLSSEDFPRNTLEVYARGPVAAAGKTPVTSCARSVAVSNKT
jgi:hypothetical protein